MAVFLRTEYNYDMRAAGRLCALQCGSEGKTQQAFKEDCDINVLMKRFGVTKELPAAARMPVYGDFSQVSDYKSALDSLARARESFDAMPAAVRRRFNNDPQELLDFLGKEENLAEAVKLGIALPRAAAIAPAPASAPAGAAPEGSAP